MTTRPGLMALERISRAILVVRGRRVMLERELAAIYGVTVKKDLAHKVAALERSLAVPDAKVQRQFNDVYEAIRALMIPPPPRPRGIGFTADLEDPGKQ
jgi:hypothetical protein